MGIKEDIMPFFNPFIEKYVLVFLYVQVRRKKGFTKGLMNSDADRQGTVFLG